MVDCEYDHDELDHLSECFTEASSAESTQECIKKIEDEGYRHLGGSTRAVFYKEGTNCVVKMSKHGDGRFNRREVERSNMDGFEGAVVPVEDSGKDNRWLTMRVVEKRSFNETPWDDVKKVKEKLRDGGWECRDIRRPNIGYLDNKPRAFDYAEECEEI